MAGYTVGDYAFDLKRFFPNLILDAITEVRVDRPGTIIEEGGGSESKGDPTGTIGEFVAGIKAGGNVRGAPARVRTAGEAFRRKAPRPAYRPGMKRLGSHRVMIGK